MLLGAIDQFCKMQWIIHRYAKYVASWYCQAPSNGLHGVDHGYGYRPAEVGWHGHREDMGAVGYKRHGMG